MQHAKLGLGIPSNLASPQKGGKLCHATGTVQNAWRILQTPREKHLNKYRALLALLQTAAHRGDHTLTLSRLSPASYNRTCVGSYAHVITHDERSGIAWTLFVE